MSTLDDMFTIKQFNILALGNGFDLFHGLRTGYGDFLKFAVSRNSIVAIRKAAQKHFKEPRQNGIWSYLLSTMTKKGNWIDIESELSDIVFFLSNILDYMNSEGKGYVPAEDFIPINAKEYRSLIHTYFKKNIGENIRPNLNLKMLERKQPHYFVPKEKIGDELKIDLDEIILMLRDYLKMSVEGIQVGISNQIASIHPDFVINFNYTNTITQYGIEDKDIFYIHGKLDAEPCNMVFGIDDNNKEDLRFIYMKKYFQRIQKKTGSLRGETIAKKMNEKGFRYESDEIVVHIFGHSLGYSDRDILRLLIKGIGSSKNIIYYRDQKDYEEKVINLIRIFGKEEIIESVGNGTLEFIPIVPLDAVVLC